MRAGEGVSALLLALNVFLLLAAYYLLKPVREALILSESGAEVKSYSAAGQALLLLGIIPLYGWVATKVNRIRLLSGMMLFFALNLALFWLGGRQGIEGRRRLLHLAGHLQRIHRLPVMGVRQRHLHGRTRPAAVPADRRGESVGALWGSPQPPAW